MRRLYLVRHAKSSWDDPALDDFDRPLSRRGLRDGRRMAAYLRMAGIRPGLVLCSAARRAAQTLELLESGLEGVPASIEAELYEAGRPDLRTRLRRLDDHLTSVLLIGHNPALEQLAESLVAGQGDGEALDLLSDKFPTGACALIETDIGHWAELADGTCRLAGFVRPADVSEDDPA
jgi:phosphohistidine phosphatase